MKGEQWRGVSRAGGLIPGLAELKEPSGAESGGAPERGGDLHIEKHPM